MVFFTDSTVIPKTVGELVISTDEVLLGSRESFLKVDTGPGDHRMLIFSTLKNLEDLKQSKVWLADGTFKTAPPMFKQMYTIHSIKDYYALPLVYILLVNKTENTYFKMLQEVRNLISGSIDVDIIITDFEIAAIKAFARNFPTSLHKCCFFHMQQNIWKRVQGTGLQSLYSSDVNVELNVKMLSAIAFVPMPNVEEAYETLTLSAFFQEHESLFVGLLDYFEDNYIGRLIPRSGRRKPLFPKILWNMHDMIINDLPKTTNNIEGWHNAFSSIVGSSHPNIWKFISCLKKSQSLTEGRMAHLSAGYKKQRPKKYKELAERLQYLALEFDSSDDILTFLKNVALNL